MKKYQTMKKYPEFCHKEGEAEITFISKLAEQNTNENNAVPGTCDIEHISVPENSGFPTINPNDIKLAGESVDDNDHGGCDELPIAQRNLQCTLQNFEEKMRQMEYSIRENSKELKSEFNSAIKNNSKELMSIIQFYAEHGNKK